MGVISPPSRLNLICYTPVIHQIRIKLDYENTNEWKPSLLGANINYTFCPLALKAELQKNALTISGN